MSRTVTVYVEGDFDVDLDQINDKDLIAEMVSRNLGTNPEEASDDINEMFYAFKFGHNDRAMDLAKKIAQDHTGRIL
jgi:hypothetical protein